MPTYDYRCRTCVTAFEVTRSITDDQPVACPQGHETTTRVFTPVAVGGAAAAPVASGGCCGGGCCG